MSKVTTLSQFIIESQEAFLDSSGSLSRVLRDIAFAAKIVNRTVNKAGLVDILGLEGSVNVQGEDVQKLDAFSNKTFIDALTSGKKCAAVASEEEEGLRIINEDDEAKYVVFIDPLDGSSNIDVNTSIGTIFSIYERDTSKKLDNESVLLFGEDQVAAGYIIYGSSTMFVYTTGDGVNGFTLDPSIGEFCLSHPNIQTPRDGKIYSINEGNYQKFSVGIKKYIKYCQQESTGPFTSRYIGSFVSDFHRNLIKGGVFIYPSTKDYPDGKLRLMYECNPMAFIMDQAGGVAVFGSSAKGYIKGKNIIDISPETIHQRVPLIIGSKYMVKKVWDFIYENDF